MKPVDLPVEADRGYVQGARGVSFLMAVEEGLVPCCVSRAALEVYFGADPEEEAGDTDASRRALDMQAPLIRQFGDAPWRRRRSAYAPAVVQTVDAVFRALSWR